MIEHVFVSRRLLIGVVLLALPLAALGAARSSSGAAPGASLAGETYVVKQGDSLWTIAVEHLGGDPREAVWRIGERNGLDGPLIQPGDTLVLP
jgi:nucleoid-associated protein YgaU